MNNIDKILNIDQEIKSLKTKIKNLERQRNELMFVTESERKNSVTCNKCGSNELCIKFKGKQGVKLIGLYCLNCIKCSKGKKTGYIKFLSKKEYFSIKNILPEIKEFKEYG